MMVAGSLVYCKATASEVSGVLEAAAGRLDSGKGLQERAAGIQHPDKLVLQHTGDDSAASHLAGEAGGGVEAPAGCSHGPAAPPVTRTTSRSECQGHQAEDATQ